MTNKTLLTKNHITSGFFFILMLLVVLLSLWINTVSQNSRVLNDLHEEQTKVELISMMRHTAHKRSITLYQMTTTEDPFERDELYMYIRQLGGEFIKARDEFFSSELSEEETSAWNRARGYLNKGGNLQHQAAEFIFNDETEKAQKILSDEIVPMQALFMTELDSLLAASNKAATLKIEMVTNKNSNTYTLIFLLGTAALLLGFFTIYVIRRTSKTEEALREQGERIRALYEVSTRADLTPDEQITETLRLGCRLLDMEIGKVGLLNPAENTSTFLNTVAPPELPIKRGKVLPLDKTYCNLTFNSSGPIALHHVGASEYKDSVSYKFLGMEAYIGTTIYVNGEKFGTVHFVNRKPRRKPFTETDKDLLNLIGSWIAVTFERQNAQDEMKESRNIAENANRSKSAFLANMSHEIRTPLTAIIGYSEMLHDQDQTEEERTHEIDSIIRSGNHLQQIINDILDLSKIEAGQLVIENLQASPFHMIADINSILGDRARIKGLKFLIDYDYPLPKQITTDPTRLKQILFNIIGNAIKFTQKGHIKIKTRYLQDSNKLSIKISDTGIGMTQDEMGRLFKPFSQADSSTTREYGGTGLGLCISKQLANNLGGDISYTSEKGEGSVFEITIGVGPADSIELVNGPEDSLIDELIERGARDTEFNKQIQKMSLGNKHILVVEDNPETQKLVSIYIKKTGATVSTANNGEIAVKRALSEDFDLILMDIQMPVMDGLEAISQLRKAGYSKPIIALTANAMKEDMDKCIFSGANDYLTKPIDLKLFYTKLKTYLDGNNIPENVTQIITNISKDSEYQELAQHFIDSMPELMKKISAAIENNDWKNLILLIQALKANSGEFGFSDIASLAAMMNTKIINKHYDDLTAHILSLNSLYGRIVTSPLPRKVS
jgi:signal transduction histidine kinase/CheY-like chemotaxis protein